MNQPGIIVRLFVLLPLYLVTIPFSIILIVFDYKGFAKTQKERGDKILSNYQQEVKGI